ncbi:uncharacterized protein N7511_005496 [Penicillium nucicola]|uniref:uncharacterized protein n=1 Tax=Penicillium nucicola TaxID=1850975 RepID=UPI002545B717|nr:uncharacterized protein N7511_005496 [Penicillium nucicola]KAJ5762114.1 hypothetical protein N7511_005496 [Penicillium nucicola]
MPITPRQITQGILKGTNALGLENAGNQMLGILYFGVTFDDKADADRVLPDHDVFFQEKKLADSRGLLHPYLFITPAFPCPFNPSCCYLNNC